jgi:hypothetical protein
LKNIDTDEACRLMVSVLKAEVDQKQSEIRVARKTRTLDATNR